MLSIVIASFLGSNLNKNFCTFFYSLYGIKKGFRKKLLTKTLIKRTTAVFTASLNINLSKKSPSSVKQLGCKIFGQIWQKV